MILVDKTEHHLQETKAMAHIKLVQKDIHDIKKKNKTDERKSKGKTYYKYE
jgi:hypothetical protein